MSPRRKSAKASSTKSSDTGRAWLKLTWDDLNSWAGVRSVERGKSYQRGGRVRDLALADDGRLLATVQGGERYFTSVWLPSSRGKSKRIASDCTCPVGVNCKHAVAVVADFLAAIADKREVPEADADDPRWARLSGDSDDETDEFDDDEDEFDEEESNGRFGAEDDDFERDADEEDFRPARKRSGRKGAAKPKRRSRAEWDKIIQTHIEQKGKEELAGLVRTLADRFPELREEFQERILLSEGDSDRLVAAALRELRSVTAEIGWRNHWDGEGNMPDYSRLKHKLERLVELGHCDEVVDLGRELITRGFDQIGQSHDEGETGEEVAECLAVVFDAVKKSSLAPVDKVLFAIDAYLEDDYGILDDAETALDETWSKTDWSLVADRLAGRVGKPSRGERVRDLGTDDFHDKYRRDGLTGFLADALERAGRGDDLLPLYEIEARATGSYQRLVNFLIQQKRYEDAERWAHEGIEKTCEKCPGIASGLVTSLGEMAKHRKQWDIVAAHAANSFFENPSSAGFTQLVAAAKRASCEERVRTAALEFLETGVLPLRPTSGKGHSKADKAADWPLPVPEYLAAYRSRRQDRVSPSPHYDVLLDMAIVAKRTDDVWKWYERIIGNQKKSGFAHGYGSLYVDSDRVAKAIEKEYPKRAVEIYRNKLDANLPHAHQGAYAMCADCLRKMRPIYKSLDQEDHWTELVADIRHKYKNRPRFMELLDRLDGKTIVKSLKSSGRR